MFFYYCTFKGYVCLLFYIPITQTTDGPRMVGVNARTHSGGARATALQTKFCCVHEYYSASHASRLSIAADVEKRNSVHVCCFFAFVLACFSSMCGAGSHRPIQSVGCTRRVSIGRRGNGGYIILLFFSSRFVTIYD